MRIVNAMFGCGRGGIEQTFIDYCQVMAEQGHDVLALMHPAAQIREEVEALAGVETAVVRNFGAWDTLAKWRLQRLVREYAPDAAILHGNRAVSLLRDKVPQGCKTVGVTHNYRLHGQIGLDGFFATTEDLRGELLRLGQPKESIHAIPNMIRLSAISPQPHVRGDVPVIAAMGRLVHVKGFAVYLEALAELRRRGVAFTALLGGKGEELAALKALAAAHELGDVLTFTGWVEDKTAFFGSADIFCLPSLNEAFGIVLLEAFAHHIPVVTSDAQGPSEIATHGVDALIVPTQNSVALADALHNLVDDAALAASLAGAAGNTVLAYDIDVVGRRICKALERVIAADAAHHPHIGNHNV